MVGHYYIVHLRNLFIRDIDKRTRIGEDIRQQQHDIWKVTYTIFKHLFFCSK